MRAVVLLLSLAGCERVAGVLPDFSVPVPDLGCARFSAPVRLPRAGMLFLVEASDSTAQRWPAISDALRSFLEDPASRGVAASLRHFPDADACDAGAYAIPDVDLRGLPDLSFAQPLQAVMPAGAAPTLPAVQGTLQYAAEQLAMDSVQRLAVVLVSDGAPSGCGSTADNVAAELAALRSFSLPGDAGLRAQLDQIRDQLKQCSFAIPAAPLEVDYREVTVAGLPFDPDCSDGGWRFDQWSLAGPREIVLCACDADRQYDVLFGCPN